ncbi:MAG TPA: ethylbenzene dehydrogenase-related protein [Bdellovibrionales bacterium]|nr:ethylbenzene dehydrogenase-related protein [Bdellovibrionales bacterium]
MKFKMLAVLIVAISLESFADIEVRKTSANLAKEYRSESVWKSAGADQGIGLLGQPMTAPKPKNTETSLVNVAAIHDGKWIVFRLRWKDSEISESEKLATFSDAVALQFPIKNNEVPPPAMMGGKDDPVHIFHWRYQYQLDAKNGKKTIDQIYPNMTTDMYPMDFKEKGNYKEASKDQKDSFVGGTAAGNPQSFPKSGVDEIFAEGFGSSAVSDSHLAQGFGEWKNGEWTVYIARPLSYENGSKLSAGNKSHIAFAVWQGGKKEIGAIKSLTMTWTPLVILAK